MRLLAIVLLVPLVLAGCTLQPITYDDETRHRVEEATAAFRADDKLQPFFEQAIAYAVFPGNWRAGSGFGAAFGNGWLFEKGELTGRAIMTELFAGPNVGIQGDRKILFFRSPGALDQFRRGRFEFTGQVNATAATAGKAITPGYHPDVAMFVQVKGGLMLEASVGTQRYDFFPLEVPEEQ